MKRLIGAAGIFAALALAAVPAFAVAFNAGSSFPANPTDGTGPFAFDLEMRVTLESDKASGPMTVYVNSHDGSMALANPHTSLWALGMPDVPDLQVHQVIVRAGQALVCGSHPRYGQGCMVMGAKGFSSVMASLASEAEAEAYFNSIRNVDQRNAPVDIASTRGLPFVHGLAGDGAYMTLWFDPGQSTVATQHPFLGPGVGVVKDYRNHTNRTVRHAFFDMNMADHSPVSWMSIHLDDLRRATHRIDTSRYRLITAFTSAKIDESKDISSWMQAEGRRIRGLEREMAGCPDGAAGNDCRRQYRARITTAQDAMRARVLNFGRANGLPIPND